VAKTRLNIADIRISENILKDCVDEIYNTVVWE
jgi:hypothetical protein